MNKRTLFKVLVIATILFCIIQLNLLGAVFAFLFLGIVPGTDLSIPPAVMMVLYPVVIIGIVYWLAQQPLYIGSQEKQEKTARAVARKRVAKKTSAAKSRRRYRKAEA